MYNYASSLLAMLMHLWGVVFAPSLLSLAHP